MQEFPSYLVLLIHSFKLYFNVQSETPIFFSGIEVDGAVGGSEAVDAIAEALRTYQNQTAEDIESGRARMDSVKKFLSNPNMIN